MKLTKEVLNKKFEDWFAIQLPGLKTWADEKTVTAMNIFSKHAFFQGYHDALVGEAVERDQIADLMDDDSDKVKENEIREEQKDLERMADNNF